MRASKHSWNQVELVYLTMLFVFLLASFLPGWRLWGVSTWSTLPIWVRLVLFGLGAAMIPLCRRWFAISKDTESEPHTGASRTHTVAAALAVAAVSGLIFYLLRGQTHFLGDGYLQLSTLAAQNPLIKGRSMGEGLVHLWVKDLLGGDGQEAALLSYRWVSIGSGVLMVIATVLAAARILRRAGERWLWALGVITGGYMLLCFGYVENYSLLCLATLLFTLAGLLTALGMLNRWFIVPLLILAVFFHALGAVLLPAAVYLLVSGSAAGAWLASRGRSFKLALGVAIAVGGGVLFYHYYSTSFYFRFAFLPLWVDRFTVDGYTLFAPRHLFDYANLLLLLFPGLPLALMLTVQRGPSGVRYDRAARFLVVLVTSALCVAFVLDPKLGMPRDWDLLSFPGVPLVVCGFLLLLRQASSRGLQGAALAISLAVLSLVPRAVAQNDPAQGIEVARSNITLDLSRNRTAALVLGKYALENGDVTAYAEMTDFRRRNYPEEPMRQRVDTLLALGRIEEAANLCRRIIEINPRLASAWGLLGQIYNEQGRYDSALVFLEVSNGLSPYFPPLLNELGRAYFFTGRRALARSAWLTSARIDPDTFIPWLALARWHFSRDESEEYGRYLMKAAYKDDAPGSVSLQLAQYHASKGEFPQAARALNRAIQRGADSTQVADLVEEYPQFRPKSE